MKSGFWNQKMDFKNILALMGVFIILFGIAGVIRIALDPDLSYETEVSASRSSTTVNENDFTARYYARQLVSDALKSPSTAVFKSESIIERSGIYYLVDVSVDSQNSFGAIVRSYFWVILKTAGEKAYYNEDIAVTYNTNDDDDLRAFKILNGWPK